MIRASLLALALVFGLGFSASSQAQIYNGWFQANAQIMVQPQVVTATVYNYWQMPIVCQGMAYGRTWNGVVVNAYFGPVTIWPGMYGYAYVYAYGMYAPFNYGWSNIACRY